MVRLLFVSPRTVYRAVITFLHMVIAYLELGLWDISYSQWAPHFSVISAILRQGLLANFFFLKNPDENFDARSFIQFLDQDLLPAMNRFNGENPRSLVMWVRNRTLSFTTCITLSLVHTGNASIKQSINVALRILRQKRKMFPMNLPMF